jgi:hypothetical protein
MVNGVHVLLYSADPAADQAVLDRILRSRTAPAEPGRIIMALPPAEIATHEGDRFERSHAGRLLSGAVLYLMCDDLDATTTMLRAEGIECTPSEDTEFGPKSTVLLPSGGEIGIYAPTHVTACDRE